MPVQGIVGGVEIEGQMLRRVGMGGDELIDQDPGEFDQGLAVDPILEAAKGRRGGERQRLVGARPAANWRAGSARRVWWSLRSS